MACVYSSVACAQESVRRCGPRWKLVLGAHAVTRPVGADAIGTRRFGSSTCNRIPRRTLLAISIYSGVIDVKRVFRLEFSSTCVPGQAQHPNDLESKSSTSPNVQQTPTAIGTSNMYYTKDRVTRAHEGTHVYVSYLLRRTSQGHPPQRGTLQVEPTPAQGPAHHQNRVSSGGISRNIRNMTIFDVKLENCKHDQHHPAKYW